MKKRIILVVSVCFLSLGAIAQEINWVTLEKALELQKKEPKKIMMDVYTSWCGPCKMLDKNTFHNKDVVAYVNEYYYAVKFNGEGNETITYKENTYANSNYDSAKANTRNSVHQLTSFLQVRAYPTIVFFNEDGDLITPIVGYKQPQELEFYLKLFKSNDYKNLDTQEKFNDYYKAFSPQFSN